MTRKIHPQATTHFKLRRGIRETDMSIARLARVIETNPKTVAKWKKRKTSSDLKMGPKNPTSTVLTAVEEALIVVFRTRTRFSVDDCLAYLKPAIPNLSRSALHRCLKRYGVSRVPGRATQTPPKSNGDPDPGYVWADIYAMPKHPGGYLLFAISMIGLVFYKWEKSIDGYESRYFVEYLVKHAPFKILLIETNQNPFFTDSASRPWDEKYPNRQHPFRKACREDRIDHIVRKVKNFATKAITRGWGTEKWTGPYQYR
jgi:transposase-like protein